MTRLLYALGTRPEVIRSARVLTLLTDHPEVDLTIVNTGQHYDENMLAGFLRELDVPLPHVDLGVGSGDPVVQTAAVMEGLAPLLADGDFDCVCVFGDTNSTLAAGLAAAKAGVPLVHVEAGCRSFDMRMPEEVNRRAVDHISALLLAVSELGATQLRAEQVVGEVAVVGDPQLDVFLGQVAGLPAGAGSHGLITIHRPENADVPARLGAILEEVASGGGELEWIFPVHPRTARSIGAVPPGVRLCEPVLYGRMLELLLSAQVCVTDSGGLQKEAFWARVPCVTVRATTEWMETVHAGANRLAQPGNDLVDAVSESRGLRLPAEYDNPYGDGRASEKIVETILTWVSAREPLSRAAAGGEGR